jgi:hypothetical protein
VQGQNEINEFMGGKNTKNLYLSSPKKFFNAYAKNVGGGQCPPPALTLHALSSVSAKQQITLIYSKGSAIRDANI